jgi:hypothetical protein
LFLAQVPSRSHHIWNKPLMDGLVKNGHNVTAVSPIVDKKNPDNLHYVHLEKSYDMIYNEAQPTQDYGELAQASLLELLGTFYWYSSTTCEGNKKCFDTSPFYSNSFFCT